MRRFADFVIRYRWFVIAALAVISIVTIPRIQKLTVNNSIKIWFVEDDPNIIAFDEFQDTFGGEEFVVVALKDEKGVFNTRDLTIIRDIGERLLEVKGISRIISVTDAVDVWGTEDGIEIGRLCEDIPKTKSEIETIRERIFSNPLFIGTIISEDGNTALITARLKSTDAIDKIRADIVRETREIAASYEETWGDKIYVAGIPVLTCDLNKLTFKDLGMFVPITAFLTIFTIFLTMRRWSAVFLSLIAVGLSVGISMGLYNLSGRELSMLSTMVPSLIMVIGVADSIHIINHYFGEARSAVGLSRRKLLTRTISVIGIPCLMTTITTAVGFSALSISQMVPVRETGLFTAVGIITAFFVTITLIPISYTFLKIPKGKKPKEEKEGLGDPGHAEFITKILEIFYRIATKHPVPIALAGLVIFLSSLFFMTKINVETQDLEFIKEEHPLRVSYSFIEENVTYISPAEVIIKGDSGSAHEPATMKAVEDFQEFIVKDPDISKTLAATDLVKRLNMAFFENDPKEYVVPETREGISQLLLLYETSPEGELDYFVDFDASTLRISGRAKNLTSNECKDLMKEIDVYFEKNLPEGFEGYMTGIVPLYVHMVDYLIRSQILSFSLAFVVIFILMMIQLRSIKLGLISILPNALPIAITMGAMGLFGINLDTATVMISTVAIGIAVDDTIHFLNRFKLEYKKTKDYEESIRATFKTTGRAIISTSIILFLGFWTLLFGSFKPTNYFGFLSGITMITAVIGDLLFLPAILLIFRPKFRI